MPLFLNNEDQAQCITPAEAINAMENAVRQLARGDAVRRPRIDNLLPTARSDDFFSFSSMEGGIRNPGYYALRIKPDIVSLPIVRGVQRRVSYSYRPGLYGGLVLLYRVDNAELLAIMNDGYIQHMRVAATAALGLRYLSNPAARVMGILGSGGMARVFAMVAKVVRPIERIQVYSPNRDRLELYCSEMAGTLGCEVLRMDSPEAVAHGADILSACTNSMEPVIQAEWIRPGVHLTNVRAPELAPDVYAKIEIVGVLVRRTPMSIVGLIDDDFAYRMDAMSYAGGQPDERARIPAGAPSHNRYPNAKHVDCCQWESGEPYRRGRPDEITTLANNSNGIEEGDAGASAGIQGIQFACVGGRIYERARELDVGRELPLDMFLQDTPT